MAGIVVGAELEQGCPQQPVTVVFLRMYCSDCKTVIVDIKSCLAKVLAFKLGKKFQR